MFDQLYILPILLFSIIIHEIAHGWMALQLGDPTARDEGRLTLNPIPHIDPFGSILVPLIAMLSPGHFFIGWAKPVPVNPMYFSNYKRDDILVSVIGPVSNIVLAFFCTLATIGLTFLVPYVREGNPMFAEALFYLLQMFSAGITLNVVLAVFNMIPIPPLDGSHVLEKFLPVQLRDGYRRIGFFGIFIIILLMSFGPFNMVFGQVIRFFTTPFAFLLHLFL